MNPFKKIGSALKVGGKFAWKTYNRPEGQVLMSLFVPAAPLRAIAMGVTLTTTIIEDISEHKKREAAKDIILDQFPAAGADKKMLNFLIEAQLQKMAGNLDID